MPDRSPAALEAHGYGSWSFCRNARKASPATIRELLAVPRRRTPYTLLIELLVDPDTDDATLIDRWQLALNTLLDLDTTYAWGSKQRRAKLEGIAHDPVRLPVIQAVAANSEEVSMDFLAVLAIDGSQVSQDAFFPHFQASFEREGRSLRWLARLRKYARPDSSIADLLDRVDEELASRSQRSPAMGLADHIGIDPGEVFWFRLWFGSSEINHHHVPVIQASLSVDSRELSWFNLWVSRIDLSMREATHIDHTGVVQDALKLGWHRPEALPSWLAHAADDLEITWTIEPRQISSNLRGRKRTRLFEWLVSQLDRE